MGDWQLHYTNSKTSTMWGQRWIMSRVWTFYLRAPRNAQTQIAVILYEANSLSNAFSILWEEAYRRGVAVHVFF